MHDELEQQLTQRNAPLDGADIRSRVLAGVHAELRSQRADRRRLRIALATFVIGVAANGWVLAPSGESPAPRPPIARSDARATDDALAEVIAEATDRATAERFKRRLALARRPASAWTFFLGES